MACYLIGGYMISWNLRQGSSRHAHRSDFLEGEYSFESDYGPDTLNTDGTLKKGGTFGPWYSQSMPLRPDPHGGKRAR